MNFATEPGAASAHGVYVANCPGQNAIAVAELTWGLILGVDRRIPDGVSALREGKWQKKKFSAARGLYGRTLGIIGVGNIGTAVGQRGRAFGMRVLAFSRTLTPRRANALSDVDEIFITKVAERRDHRVGGGLAQAGRPNGNGAIR